MALTMIWLVGAVDAQKQIALTFDDAPRPGPGMSPDKRSLELMNALAAVGVKQVMFFVTTKHLDESSRSVLDLYRMGGHLIANHSDQHQWLHQTELQAYQQDFLTAHQQLHNQPHFRPYFRYPYLDQGRDRKVAKKMQKFLRQQGYQHGYVTVDNYDWYLEKLFQDAVQAGLIVDKERMKQLYIDVLWAAIQHADQVAEQYLGRSPKHVLLLHDNDLAAYFVGDLVRHLEANGWEIISPEEAYEDPIAKQIPKTLFTGQGRVAALAHDAGAAAKDLVHVAEDEAELERLFKSYQVATAVGEPIPEWLVAVMNNQLGTWKASNESYVSNREPYTEYVLAWTWGLQENSLSGQLSGWIDGQHAADLWDYKLFWDPHKQQARMLQFGASGQLGEGTLKFIDPRQTELLMQYAAPGQSMQPQRFSRVLTPEAFLTTSYGQDASGQWLGQRSYAWVKQSPAAD